MSPSTIYSYRIYNWSTFGLAIMAILASEALLHEKKIQWQNVTPNLTFACKTETLGSLYNHALLILLKSSKFKYQVVHEQIFKDLLSSTC